MSDFDFTGGTALSKLLDSSGRFPSLAIDIYPLDYNSLELGAALLSQPVHVERFTSYEFSSSVIVPVDTFKFTFSLPGSTRPLSNDVKEGDVIIISANDKRLLKGYVESVDIEVTNDGGEKVTVSGKDFLGYFEMQTAISIDDLPIYMEQLTIKSAISRLCHNTRIQEKDILVKDDPGVVSFATEIGETKMSALQRCVDPLNLLFWMDEDGKLVIGKPDFSAKSSGKIICNRSERRSNVNNIRARRESANIPSVIVPVYAGQEKAQTSIAKEQRIINPAKGPLRLFNKGHRVVQLVQFSFPSSGDSLAATAEALATLKTTQNNMTIGYAAREFAKHNMKELTVEATVGGHFNESGDPYMPDTVYDVEFERAGIREAMYLHSVHYQLSEDGGQFTRLEFCKLYSTIVANNTLAGSLTSDINAVIPL